MIRGRRYRTALWLGVLAVVLAGAADAAGFWERLEGITWDWRARRLADPAPRDIGIKLVLIDGPSLTRIATEQEVRWPWPRAYFAALLEYLHADGARAVVFDLDFVEPSGHSVEDDTLLRAAIEPMRNFAMPLRLQGEAMDWPQSDSPLTVHASVHAEPRAGATFSHRDVVGGLALAFGHVAHEPAPDGIVRHVRAVYEFAGRTVPQLAIAGYAVGAELPPVAVEADELRLGDKRYPLTSDGDLLLRYRAPRAEDGHLYEAFSAAGILADVANGRSPTGRYRDAYVLVGVSAENLFDNWATPVNPVTAGVEVHATVLDNLLHEGFLRPVPAWIVMLAALALAVFAAVVLLRSSGLLWNLAGAALLVPLPLACAFAAYAAGRALPAVWPTIAVGLAVFGAGSLNYATEGRRRLYLRRAFEHYLSPKVIARIVEDPARLELGGERRQVSVLFSDIEGFTGISERMDPHDLGLLLNDVLGDLTDIVLDEYGTLDKYQGDAILAFWNAPADQADHAACAVRAGIRFQRRLAERRVEFAERAGRDLRVRVGVHTGIATVGNFGSGRRFSYTALGDTVNLASRLEGANKYMRTAFLVSEETWQQAKDAAFALPVGRIQVAGRAEAVRVYEPVALASEAEPPRLALFRRACAACEAAAWDDAEEVLGELEDDRLAALYRERVSELRRAGATAWDDLWNLTSK